MTTPPPTLTTATGARCAAGRLLPVLGWLAAAGCAAAIIKGTRIGPVVLVVSDQRGWGVHTGDALALVPVAAAVLLHLRLLRR